MHAMTTYHHSEPIYAVPQRGGAYFQPAAVMGLGRFVAAPDAGPFVEAPAGFGAAQGQGLGLGASIVVLGGIGLGLWFLTGLVAGKRR